MNKLIIINLLTCYWTSTVLRGEKREKKQLALWCWLTTETRSRFWVNRNKKPTNWWASRNTTSLNLKISADIMFVISGDLASNCGRIIRLFASWTRLTQFYAIFGYILAGRKQLVTPYPVWLHTKSVWLSVWNLVILHETAVGLWEPLILWWTNDNERTTPTLI